MKNPLDKKGPKMKRIGNIYEKIFTTANLTKAIYNVAKGKKDRREVNHVLSALDDTIKRIQGNPHITGEYLPKTKTDSSSGKTREILEPKFYPDQIIHHALCQIIEPVMTRGMYKYCSGSVKKRGMLYASNIIRRSLVKRTKDTKWFVKLDVTKYYEHIDHEVLKSKFRRVIKDPKVLALMDEIVDSTEKGLPIGNYTSQWFANFYLQDFDHYVKEQIRIPVYVRYMDDMVLIGPNKRKLEEAVLLIRKYLKDEMKLDLHDEIEVKRVAYEKGGKIIGNFIDFCGYRHYRGFTTIRRRIWRRIHRLFYRLKKWISLKRARSFMSYYGYIIHSDSKHVEKKYFTFFDMKVVRQIIREESLRQLQGGSL